MYLWESKAKTVLENAQILDLLRFMESLSSLAQEISCIFPLNGGQFVLFGYFIIAFCFLGDIIFISTYLEGNSMKKRLLAFSLIIVLLITSSPQLLPTANAASKTYIDVVEEALCFGWIDSTLKKLPDGRLAQRLSPRRKNSHWTQLNIDRCIDLEARGLMTPAGRRASWKRD